MTTRSRHTLALLLAAACGFAGTSTTARASDAATATPPPPARVAPAEVDFRALEEAAAESAARERVLAIYFTAEWCGWCRKMESSTFADAGVIAGAQSMSWAKVDIDARPDIAAIFGVRGVPAMAFLNARGEFLGDRAGYVTAPQMLEILATYRGKGLADGAFREGLAALYQAKTSLVDAKTEEELLAAVRQTLDLLADPRQRPQREQLRHSVVSAGPRAWPALVAALADERLSIRAAASDLLRAGAPQSPAVDPFAEPVEREAQIAAARQWLASQAPPAADPESGVEAPDRDGA